MFIMIYNELIKLKRTSIFYIALVGGLILPIFLFLSFIFFEVSFELDFYLQIIEIVMFMMLGIILFSLLASYVFSREFGDETSRVLFTYPVSRVKIYYSKLILIYLIMFLVYFLQFITAISEAAYLGLPGEVYNIFIKHLKIYTLSLCFQYALIPIIVFITLLSRNNIVALVFSVISAGANLITFMVGGGESKISIPTILPALAIYYFNDYKVNLHVMIYEGIGIFIIGNILTVYYLKKMDIM